MSIAIMGIINRLTMFILMPIFGIAQGFQPIAGYNYGAKHYHKIKEVMKLAYIYSTLIALIGFAIIMLIPGILFRMFTSDPNLIIAGASAIRYTAIFLYLIGFQVVGSTLFQAIGKPLQAFFLSLSRQIIIFIPLVMILPKFFALNGVWLTPSISDLLAFMITLFFVSRQLKKFNVGESVIH